jgi:dynein heavy chain
MQAINKHIKKCFDNINRLDLGSDPKSVMVEGMISGEGERVLFTKPISTKAEIEIWLTSV